MAKIGPAILEGRLASGTPPLRLQTYLTSFLLSTQRPDGGWGYRAGSLASAVEPTSWALKALSAVAGQTKPAQSAARGLCWLSGSQLADGSWPQFPGQTQGCWTASLACGAYSAFLARSPESCEIPLARGLEWLCNSTPGENSWRSRVRFRLRPTSSPRTPGVYGWSWTKNTSSWVEPTAHALLALRAAPSAFLPKRAKGRIARAERFLFTRRCREEGWDVGNPPCDGIGRTPQPECTAWALMALSNYADRTDVKDSIDWLESRAPLLKGWATRSVVQICLQAYGRAADLLPGEPWGVGESQDTLAASWMTLAADGSWPASTAYLEGN
ncbi:MAG: hypothetical protein ACRD10_12865 [Terriglobia bacterium]